MMIETTKLYILLPVFMLYEKLRIYAPIFLQIDQSRIKGENFIYTILWNILNFGLRLDSCEPFCFRLGVRLDMSKLCSMIKFEWPWPSLKVAGELELVQSFCFNIAWSNPYAFDGWLCKGDEAKKSSKCGEYGLLGHLLFLYLVLSVWSIFDFFSGDICLYTYSFDCLSSLLQW